MLDTYLAELSAGKSWHQGAASYPYLDVYWQEAGRFPFRILFDGEDVGFALVRGPASTEIGTYELAEFFVQLESRRRGVGRRAVKELCSRFSGQ